MTGNEHADGLQDSANNLVAGQLGQGGSLRPVGDVASHQVLTRSERKGKDDEGVYVPGGGAAAALGRG